MSLQHLTHLYPWPLHAHTKDIFVEQFGIQINTLYFENISPGVIFLHPPEKLVIEVRSRGRYSGISWERTSASVDRSLLSNYNEIFALGRTTSADYGWYQGILLPSPPSFQDIVPSSIMDFIVTAPGLNSAIIITSSEKNFLSECSTID